jgi:hypothetical protein
MLTISLSSNASFAEKEKHVSESMKNTVQKGTIFALSAHKNSLHKQ